MRDSPSHGPVPETPRSEPEIIPPGQGERTGSGRASTFVFVDRYGRTRRVSAGTLRPFGIILALLTIGLVAGLILLVVFGALLIWIPLMAVTLAGLLLFALVRGYWRRLWNR